MVRWQQCGSLWVLEPHPNGEQRQDRSIAFIGGSYLAAAPQLSYRRLLEALAQQGWRVLAWSYVPGFDHQAQANEAWRAFRSAGPTSLRLGHSLGCKLHLLAPDGGRGCNGLVALSFNNFSAERSVPLLAELGQQLNFRSEFSPSPEETLRQVAGSYRQSRNLLVRFDRDGIDQSSRLLGVLQARAGDNSELLELPGDHLTPASGGLRRQVLGAWADDPRRQRAVERLAGAITRWA
jgi:allophanate hydrolase subunit 1